MRRRRRLRNLPLFWRLLIPYVVLLLIVGLIGGFLIVRDLTSRAQTTLDRDLSRRSLDARSVLHSRELYLLESANFAANLQGMADALERGSSADAEELLGSVRALKSDLTVLALTNADGSGLVEFLQDPGNDARRRSGTAWGEASFVAEALRDTSGTRRSGFASVEGRSVLAIAAPVCQTTNPCRVVGAAIVGMDVVRLATEASGASVSDGDDASEVGIAIYDESGRLLSSAGLEGIRKTAPDVPAGRVGRFSEQASRENVDVVYAPLEVQARRVGTVGVAMPSDAAFASARATGLRLAGILLAAIAAIVALGALLSRSILAQVKPLVATNRALGEGDLTARAEIVREDELGELARGVNQMAEQLQASRETLELRVEQRTQEVRRLLKERSELFAALSHELRTPISLILGNGELLLDPEAPRATVWRAETTRAIVDSAGHLLELVNDILDLAKAEGGRIELASDEVKFFELVEDLRPTVEGLARAGELAVTINVPKRLPAVRGDRKRLREVVLNLMDNAVKYTPPGGTVSLTGSARNGHVELAVSDTGPGLPANVGERVFEPFYRVEGTKAQRDRPSSGLGLAISKRFVEAHGGAISYDTEPGHGTTFRFTVPHEQRATRNKKRPVKSRR